jgi:ABC-type nitrate/sulfonate/bicarbonate transport system substrate-binding protein
MVAGLQNQVVSTIVAVKGIDKVDDVRGKNVAVTKVGNSDYYTWVDLAQKRGWNIEDFKFVAANDQPGQVQMLGSGNAQAISVSPPVEVSAVRAGGHVILDLTKEQIPLQQIGIVLTKSWLAKNRDKALNALKATIEAEHRWKTDPAFTKGVIKKWLKEDDQAFIDSGYDNFKDVWTTVPYPSREGFLEQVREVSSLNPAVRDVNVDQCMDMSLVKELEDSGFIKQVYGS